MNFKLINLVLLTASFWVAAVDVSAASAAKVYPIKDVSELVVGGDTEVELVQDGSEYLRIDAEAEVLERVKVDQSGKTLSIKVKNKGGWFSWFSHDSEHIRVSLRLKQLNFVELSGAARLKAGDLVGDALKLEASGASDFKVAALNYSKLKIDLSGASNAHLERLTSQTLSSEISGASNLEVKSGGQVQFLIADASGASNLHAKSLQAVNAQLEASGASSISLAVSGTLKAKASGASGINYYGAPKADTNSSGASQINAHAVED